MKLTLAQGNARITGIVCFLGFLVVTTGSLSAKRITGTVYLFDTGKCYVTINATNLDTHAVTKTETKDFGQYVFDNLPPGRYSIAVDDIRFKPSSFTITLLPEDQEKNSDIKLEYIEYEIEHPCEESLRAGVEIGWMPEPERLKEMMKRCRYHPPLTIPEKEKFAAEIIGYLEEIGITPLSKKAPCETMILTTCINMLGELRLASLADIFLDYATFKGRFTEPFRPVGPLTLPPWDQYPSKYALHNLRRAAAEPIFQRLRLTTDEETQIFLIKYFINALGKQDAISFLNTQLDREIDVKVRRHLSSLLKIIENDEWDPGIRLDHPMSVVN